MGGIRVLVHEKTPKTETRGRWGGNVGNDRRDLQCLIAVNHAIIIIKTKKKSVHMPISEIK